MAQAQSCANHVQHIESLSRATCVLRSTKGQNIDTSFLALLTTTSIPPTSDLPAAGRLHRHHPPTYLRRHPHWQSMWTLICDKLQSKRLFYRVVSLIFIPLTNLCETRIYTLLWAALLGSKQLSPRPPLHITPSATTLFAFSQLGLSAGLLLFRTYKGLGEGRIGTGCTCIPLD